jgi:pimeloyl-ACP methyl ester carboxylesterase
MAVPESRIVRTSRLAFHVWVAGDPKSPPVVLVHGNVSSAVFYDRIQAELGERFFVIAPDLRGYGQSEAKPVDASRGMGDYADDLVSLLVDGPLGIPGDAKLHLLGWSAGANVIMQLAIDHPERVASLVLINPGSPFGFGGTKGEHGEPCYPDFAGSGGGTANPQFVERLVAKDRSAELPVSPRNVMNAFYWKPPFRPEPEREDRFVEAMLQTAIGEHHYPGDMTTSPNWPGVAPGTGGMNNALSPKHLDQSALARIDPKPPILWVRGADDQIVSDRSMFDFGVLGELGVVPGWPGAEQFPAQPMVAQTRAVLERYAAGGGVYREVVIEDAGHGPHIEKHDEFMALIAELWA